jgi:hypothetical protein
MTLPAPLRVARAVALFQGWAAGLGVFVMLGVAVLAAGGLRNGAFVALALLFLAGDVLAVAIAVVIAARRLAEGAAWARLLLDVVEGVTIAVGLLATLLGSGVLGLSGVVLGAVVLVGLHAPSANAVFDGQPILPWEASRPQPPPPVFPVPSLPPRRRSDSTRPVTAPPAPTPPGPRRSSWEPAPPPSQPPRVQRPADLPSAADRTIPRIEPLPPVATPEPPAPAPPVTPPLAGADRPSYAPRQGSVTVHERRSRASAARPRPPRPGMPPAPSWGWRKVVVAASLLGAVAGGTLSAIELIAGGGSHVPATGEAPAPQPPRSGALPGQPSQAPGRPRTERSEPAAAGGVAGVTLTPGGACAAGGSCTVTVRVDLDPHPDTLVAWTIVVVDRCSGRHAETAVSGVPAPASYRYVLSTNQIAVPAWRAPQILAVTTSPARASSQAVVLGGASGC